MERCFSYSSYLVESVALHVYLDPQTLLVL
jgi:hypothetical protein